MQQLIRVVVTGVLVAFVALPAIRVHTAALPILTKMRVEGNDLASLTGTAAPNANIGVWYRQRAFKEGTYSNFQWCEPTWSYKLFLGTAISDAGGNWKLENLDLQVYPSSQAERTCGSGLQTQVFLFQNGDLTEAVPDMVLMRVQTASFSNTVGEAQVEADIMPGATRVAASIADGPEDAEDVDQDGNDNVCNTTGCGFHYIYQCGPGGTVQCPSVPVFDPSTLLTPSKEFPFVIGTVTAHRPRGSMFAAVKNVRPANTGPAFLQVNVNVDIRAKFKLECESGPSLPFSFF